MTRYEYLCLTCGYFEAWAGRDDDTLDCPKCGAKARRADVSGIPSARTETVGFKPSKEIVRG